ncbi:MAG TPA: cytochrome P450 [Acidimicrobiales bacterium]|nr:cytochrome P450 [Acidimicrobiales bacterium]
MSEAPDLDFVSGDFWGRDPHAGLTWMRQHAPVCWNRAAGVWGITKYDDIKEISKHPDVWSSAGGIRPDSGPTGMMIEQDDPLHWQRRKLVNKGFTPQQVRAQEAKVRDVVDRLFDRVLDQGQCDFVTDIAAWLPLVMIGDALGFDEADHPTLLKWSDDLMRGLGQDDADRVTSMMAAFEGYTAYMADVIRDRRATPRDDLTSILAHAEVDGDRFDDDTLVSETLLILIGGDETTRHVITGGLYQLMANRDQWDALLADRSLLPSAIEEMLRWVTPIKNMARTATRDVEVRGETIREGQKVLLLYPSANRDEEQFADPFEFDITRSPNEHVAFGFGTHFCLGNSLARLELQVMFEQLLDRLPGIHLVADDEPPHRPANFVSGYETMKVAW